jgi:hypothetical protein
MAKEDDKVTIKIPRVLYNNLRTIIEGSGFNSVTDFIVFVLRDLTLHATRDSRGQLSMEELEAVRKRLKNLGYL